jgi:hypothetical protein
VANAIYNATGARVDSTPFKPEKVLAALEEVKREQPYFEDREGGR